MQRIQRYEDKLLWDMHTPHDVGASVWIGNDLTYKRMISISLDIKVLLCVRVCVHLGAYLMLGSYD